MRLTLVCGIACLGIPLVGQTWSPFPAPGTPIGEVAASSRGLLSVAYFGALNTLLVREYDGSNWVNQTAPTPPPREGFALAYDSTRQRVVLFGGWTQGATPSYFADTWEWTGTAWQPQITLAFPSGRSDARMVFDSGRNRMVLFGGGNSQGVLSETWEYAAPQWTQGLSAGPPPGRVDCAMAYDPSRQCTVMFGGWASATHGDTWVWDGVAWQQRLPANPPQARSQHGMCYDPYAGGVLMFGGMTSNFNPTYLNDAYVWNGTDWVSKPYYQRPVPRSGHRMALDEVASRVVLMGGYSAATLTLSDAWKYPGVISAVAQTYGSGCGNLSAASLQSPVLGSAGMVTVSRPSPIYLAYMSVGLSRHQFGPLTLPLPLGGYGLPGCSLLQDAAITAFAPCSISAGSATFSATLPNIPQLSGLQLFLQAWVPDAAANTGGLVTSNGLEWVLGNF